MKQTRKSTKTVSKYPFKFFERKHTNTKFENPYSDQLQTAVKGTNDTASTAENRIINRKLIRKPITPFEQEPPTEVLDQEDRTKDLPAKKTIPPITPDPHYKAV